MDATKKWETEGTQMAFSDYLNLPADERKQGTISRPEELYAFTEISLRFAKESFLLRDDLQKLLPELDHRVLPDEKEPYLKHALKRMTATALYLFETRKTMVEHGIYAPWTRELRITTNKAIFFGASLYGGSYVEAAKMLAAGIVAAVCSLPLDRGEPPDDITPFLPRMRAPEYFSALEDDIRKTTDLVEQVLLEWPEFETYLHLCLEEFLNTVTRLGIQVPDGTPWRDFITHRDPVEGSQELAESHVAPPPVPVVAGEWLTVAQAVERFMQEMEDTIPKKRAKPRITKECNAGRIQCTGKGRARRVNLTSLKAWILEQRNKARDAQDHDMQIRENSQKATGKLPASFRHTRLADTK